MQQWHLLVLLQPILAPIQTLFELEEHDFGSANDEMYVHVSESFVASAAAAVARY